MDNTCSNNNCNNKCKTYKYCYNCKELNNKSYNNFINNYKKCINYDICKKYNKNDYKMCYNCNNEKLNIKN